MRDNEQILDLIQKLNYYTKKYDEGKPEISDEEWDNMYFQLQELENETGIYYEDSPTQRVNYQVVNELKKVTHNHPMLSLDKTKDLNAVRSFLGNEDYICMAKMDGLTCSLRYLNGKLVAAETRGNGLVGEDILHNALQVKNIPKKINCKEELIVDGEIICTYDDFKYYEAEYKNPRNFASGSIRLLSSEESAMRRLTFIAWDCVKGLDWSVNSLTTKLLTLKYNFNFTIVPYICGNKENNNLEEQIECIKVESRNYPIDGVVFKYDNIYTYEAAGRTDHHFKGGIAYKFYDEEYETTLQDIEWSIGRTGVLTPVAILKPVEIDGTEVSRASLHNISIMKELLGKGWKGQKVWVFKSNMIIPQISKAEDDNEYTKNYFDIPPVCPICHEPTIIKNENGSEMLYCSNPHCEGKFINHLDHFCGKKGLDIKGLSTATLEKIINWGWVSNLEDIFKLENFSKEWKNKAGFGEKSVERILEAINNSKNTTLDKVIAAAGIPLIGSRVAKDLTEIYHTWTDFRNETNFEYIDGIGPEMNSSLINFDYSEIDKVIPYLNIINSSVEKNNKLENLTFCITGKLKTFKNRDELIKFIEDNGGKVVSSVSSKVNYLINNDINSTSSKNKTAKELNIQIITEEILHQMCNLE